MTASDDPYSAPGASAAESESVLNLPIPDDLEITARSMLSPEHYQELVQRFGRLNGTLLRPRIYGWIMLFVPLIAAAIALTAERTELLLGVGLGFGGTLAVIGYLRLQSKKLPQDSPWLNLEQTIVLTVDNVCWKTLHSESHFDWPMFTQVAFFDDGVLLMQGQNQGHWVRYDSLSDSGQTQWLDRLLRSRIQEHCDLRSAQK